MTTSRTAFLSEITNGEAIPAGKLEYFRSRLSNRLHELIIDEFVRLSETRNFTKAELARRIGREPAQITRWLSAPSNWTIDTLSDLALGMGTEPAMSLFSLLENKNIVPARATIATDSDVKPAQVNNVVSITQYLQRSEQNKEHSAANEAEFRKDRVNSAQGNGFGIQRSNLGMANRAISENQYVGNQA